MIGACYCRSDPSQCLRLSRVANNLIIKHECRRRAMNKIGATDPFTMCRVYIYIGHHRYNTQSLVPIYKDYIRLGRWGGVTFHRFTAIQHNVMSKRKFSSRTFLQLAQQYNYLKLTKQSSVIFHN